IFFVCALLIFASSLSAQSIKNKAGNAIVLATVNGEEITQADIDLFYQELPDQMKQIPVEQVQNQILDRLIDQQLILGEAKKARLDKRPDIERKLAYEKTKILNESYLEIVLEKEVTPERIREVYNRAIALEEKREEIKARHILVKTEAEALDIINALKRGGDFISLAKERSTGPSGKNGGDLGFFTADQMVPPFSKAAYALRKGETSDKPVQTQFGWHVIKVEDRRLAGAQPFQELEPQIREQLVTKAYEKIIQQFRKTAKIEKMNLGTSGFQRVQ
ncbi:MAG: peptidylprolyl isomerase, partial [Rhodospirillaceae bacterium]